MLSAQERTLRAKVAAYARHARTDGHAAIAPAHAGRWAKLLATVDPDGVLPEPERVRRAEALRKSQLYRASLKSARVRAAKKAATAAQVTAQEVDRASDHTTKGSVRKLMWEMAGDGQILGDGIGGYFLPTTVTPVTGNRGNRSNGHA